MSQHLELCEGKLVSVNSDGKRTILTPTVDEIVNLGYPIPQANSILSYYRNNPYVVVPNEYKHKYCLVFGGRVFHSFDTMEALVKKNNEEHLDYKIYYPPQHFIYNKN